MSLIFKVMQRPEADPMRRLLVLSGGDYADLASKVGEDVKTVYNWFYRNQVPADRVVDVCRAYGNQIEPRDLRPDIFKSNETA